MVTRIKLTTIGISKETKEKLKIIAKQNSLKSMDKTISILLESYNSINYNENQNNSRPNIYDYY